jgi:hypothetical protein
MRRIVLDYPTQIRFQTSQADQSRKRALGDTNTSSRSAPTDASPVVFAGVCARYAKTIDYQTDCDCSGVSGLQQSPVRC